MVLLSFTFGSDRMHHWYRITRTPTCQRYLVLRPDGAFLCHGVVA
jgi:hypothetical protein